MAKLYFYGSCYLRHGEIALAMDWFKIQNCSDCGTIISSNSEQYFYLLEDSQVEISGVFNWQERFKLVNPDEPTVAVKLMVWGHNKNGQYVPYCWDCAQKVETVKCGRCETVFSRARSLPCASICENCFKIHAEAMCHVRPAKYAAALAWGDEEGRKEYEDAFVAAKAKSEKGEKSWN